MIKPESPLFPFKRQKREYNDKHHITFCVLFFLTVRDYIGLHSLYTSFVEYDHLLSFVEFDTSV